MNRYTAILTYSADDGWWTGTCAEVPAAITQGRTVEEAKENLKDAIALVIETQREAAVKDAGASAKVEPILVAAP